MPNEPLDELLEAVRTNSRITLMLFDAVEDEGMACTLSKRGGRDVLRQFAHIHDVRRMHIEKRGRGLGIALAKFPAKEAITRAAVREALVASGKALEKLFRGIDAGEASCMKKGPINYLSYFVSHEAHHRGSVLLTLKQCGYAVDKDTRYNIWDWDRR